MNSNNFIKKYKLLERGFQLQAEADGNVFLPNVTPKGQVDFVFIAGQPSFGPWASSNIDAKRKVENGFRNFLTSMEITLLHHSIREYLCHDGQTYHLTDISKGAMLVDEAKKGQEARYLAWYKLLREELMLMRKPKSLVFAIGKSVESFLIRQGFRHLSDTLLHYSGQAAGYRRMCIQGKEDEFEAFAKKISHKNILNTAVKLLMESNVPYAIQNEAINRVERSELTNSRKMLLFCYKTTFMKWRNFSQ